MRLITSTIVTQAQILFIPSHIYPKIFSHFLLASEIHIFSKLDPQPW